MAKYGSDCLGGSQAIYGYLLECISRILCEAHAHSLGFDQQLMENSSLATAPDVIMKVTTGSGAVSTT